MKCVMKMSLKSAAQVTHKCLYLTPDRIAITILKENTDTVKTKPMGDIRNFKADDVRVMRGASSQYLKLR